MWVGNAVDQAVHFNFVLVVSALKYKLSFKARDKHASFRTDTALPAKGSEMALFTPFWKV